ncbi:MAG: integrase core domain-containing protein [Acidimicrobiales bacterium]
MQFVAKQPACENISELQHQLDHFADLYNNQRPHRSLG